MFFIHIKNILRATVYRPILERCTSNDMRHSFVTSCFYLFLILFYRSNGYYAQMMLASETVLDNYFASETICSKERRNLIECETCREKRKEFVYNLFLQDK